MQTNFNTRRIVVVVGMHRSGTSLLGGVLQSLGIDLGQRLIQGDSHNEAGYFEHAGIVRLQRDLLVSLDRRWTGPKGTLPLPAGWQLRPETLACKAELLKIVTQEMAQAQGVWGFKDPRTSRFVPMWTEIFGELGVTPLYLLSVRHPEAVAGSVIRRDAISAARAELLWLVHNLDALRDVQDAPLRVVDYDRWFSHMREQAWAVMEALGLAWPADDAELMRQLGSHIRPELRHHTGTQKTNLPHVRETYDLLVEAAITGSLPPRLAAIQTDVARAQDLLQAWAEVVEAGSPPALSAAAGKDLPRASAGGLRAFLGRLAPAPRERETPR